MRAFSILELIFVIIVGGIIAAIALPKLALTRSDAQYTAILADIQSINSAITQKFLVEDLNPAALDGNLIMQTARLSTTRWIPQGSGVRLAKNGALDSANNCVLIDFQQNNLVVRIDPAIISPLCKKLAQTYPNPLITPLESTTIKL